MAVFGDFFGDLFGDPESDVARLARAMGRQWGEGAMRVGEESDPSEWHRFVLARAGLLNDCRLFLEAVYEQAFPPLAEHSLEAWEAIKRVPPAPATMLLGDRLSRLKAYCQVIMGARVVDVLAALENLAGVTEIYVLQHVATDVTLDPEQIFVFWTIVSAATWADEDLRDDINTIVDRWKPGHSQHGRNAGNPRGGVRVGSSAGPAGLELFKTGVGPEKTSRNLIRLT